jgi:outer membrane immunogenic protein
MRKTLGLAGAALLFAGPALAADLAKPPPVFKAPPPVPVFNWTGWYIGGNIGYGWGQSTNSNIVSDTTGFGAVSNFPPSLKPKGVIGGGQIGYDWQVSPHFVWGLVADFQGADIKDSQTSAGTFDIPPVETLTESLSQKLQFLGTGRVRAGWAAGQWLFYGSGGVAYGDVKSTFDFTASVPGSTVPETGSRTETRVGWAAGGGVNYAVTPNWILGVDYLHYDLGRTSVTATLFLNPNTAGQDPITASQKVGGDIVRATINYKF